jgi:hypothetical protein
LRLRCMSRLLAHRDISLRCRTWSQSEHSEHRVSRANEDAPSANAPLTLRSDLSHSTRVTVTPFHFFACRQRAQFTYADADTAHKVRRGCYQCAERIKKMPVATVRT